MIKVGAIWVCEKLVHTFNCGHQIICLISPQHREHFNKDCDDCLEPAIEEVVEALHD